MAGIPFWMILMFVGCWCGWGRCRCKGGCHCDDSGDGCHCGAGCMCGWRCRKRSSRLFANLVIVWLILSIMGGGMGMGIALDRSMYFTKAGIDKADKIPTVATAPRFVSLAFVAARAR